MGFRPLTPGSVETDIARIINTATLHPNAITYKVILHTADDDIDITELVSVEVSRDYAGNICDFTIVTFVMAMGLYIRRVRPNMDNLEMTIITKHYKQSYTDRYKLVILKGPNNVAGSIYSSYSEDELNQMDKFVIEGQCVSRLVEVLRLKPADGVYSYSKVSDLIKTILTNGINSVKVEDTVVEAGISVIPPNNDKVFRHINIPTGVRLLDIPSFLQNTDYGVYSADIGTYVQRYGYFEDGVVPKETIFVYPLYNNTLADEPGKKLMILSSPTTIMSQVENSYIIEGDIIKIIGSGDMDSTDVSQNKIMDTGGSLVVANPDSVMTNGVVVTNDKVTTTTTDVAGTKLVSRRDGLDSENYVRPTSNPYKLYSEIAKNVLSPYQITWNYSNPQLLFPGMPVIYVYEDIERGVIRLTGVLHSVYHKYNAAFKTHTTVINVLLESYIDGADKVTEEVDVSRN